jgi:hypothetical protein
MDINILISYITSSELQQMMLPLKLCFFAISLIFLSIIIFVLLKTDWLRHAFLEKTVEFLSYHPYGMKKISKGWSKVLSKLEKGSEAEYKMALIEADEMFDNTLEKMGYSGKTLEDRIKQASAVLSNTEQIQEAHKTRNNVAYDPNYKLGLDEAKRILEVFEQAFRDLEAF